MLRDALALLKQQDELLRKLQKDKDKLCLDVSEWKHKYHDKPLNKQEIIRCKNCKHGKKSSTFRYYPNLTWCNKYKCSHDDSWFCADGVAKNIDVLNKQFAQGECMTNRKQARKHRTILWIEIIILFLSVCYGLYFLLKQETQKFKGNDDALTKKVAR